MLYFSFHFTHFVNLLNTKGYAILRVDWCGRMRTEMFSLLYFSDCPDRN